jgi:DNA-3-methyladenine glycosylase
VARTRTDPNVLPRTFYDRPTLTVARGLLGKVLVHHTPEGVASGMIVETEAYIGEDDPACHAAPGPTRRNAPLYGRPGMAYVYLNYGIHYLVNAVTEAQGRPAAVLIRALEPLDGIELMLKRRGPPRTSSSVLRTSSLSSSLSSSLCRGPGNLTRALGITLSENLLDLTHGPLTIEERGLSVGRVSRGPRIGIRVAVERPWRFWIRGHPAVSGAQIRA